MQQATIVYCIRNGEVLLGMKKLGFGAGKWNGFGGKVNPGEAPRDGAARELHEEAGLVANAAELVPIAYMEFFLVDEPQFACHVYRADRWTGEPVETDEMRPQWFPIDALPIDDMWVSDTYWLPHVLGGRTLRGTCRFFPEFKGVERFDIEDAVF